MIEVAALAAITIGAILILLRSDPYAKGDHRGGGDWFDWSDADGDD